MTNPKVHHKNQKHSCFKYNILMNHFQMLPCCTVHPLSIECKKYSVKHPIKYFWTTTFHPKRILIHILLAQTHSFNIHQTQSRKTQKYPLTRSNLIFLNQNTKPYTSHISSRRSVWRENFDVNKILNFSHQAAASTELVFWKISLKDSHQQTHWSRSRPLRNHFVLTPLGTSWRRESF